MPAPWEKYQALEPAAGPWDKYKPDAPPDDSGHGAPYAAAQGFGNFGTLGYLPEAQTKSAGLLDEINRAGAKEDLRKGGSNVPDAQNDAPGTVNEKLRNQGFIVDDPAENQPKNLANARAEQTDLAQSQPWPYYGGGIAGAVATSPVYGAGFKAAGMASEIAPAAEGSGLLAKAGVLGKHAVQQGIQGGALGFAANPNAEGESTDLNIDKRATSALTGAALGAAIPPTIAAGKGLIQGGKVAASETSSYMLSNLFGVRRPVIKEYVQFSNRINASPNIEALKTVSDDFVGKLSEDVQSAKLKLSDAKEAFNGFKTDLSNAYQSHGFEAREAVASAKETLSNAYRARLEDTAQDLVDTIKQLQGDVGKGSAKSFEILEGSGVDIPVAPVKAKLTLLMNELKIAGAPPVGSDAKAAYSQLQSIRDTLDEFPKRIPAAETKKLLQQIQRSASYGQGPGQFSQSADKALKELGSSINSNLKGKVPAYDQQMESVAADTGLLKNAQDFGDRSTGAGLLKNIDNPNQADRRATLEALGKRYNSDFVSRVNPDKLPEAGLLSNAEQNASNFRPDRVKEVLNSRLAASAEQGALTQAEKAVGESESELAPFKSLAPNAADQTRVQAALKTLAKGENVETIEMFKKLGKLTDTDFVQAMHDQHILAAFEKGAVNGSRNTMFGSVLGYLMGGVGGAGAGAGIGRLVDQFGPVMTKKILNGYIKVVNSPSLATIRALDLPPQLKERFAQGISNFIETNKSGLKGQAVQPNMAKENPKNGRKPSGGP